MNTQVQLPMVQNEPRNTSGIKKQLNKRIGSMMLKKERNLFQREQPNIERYAEEVSADFTADDIKKYLRSPPGATESANKTSRNFNSMRKKSRILRKSQANLNQGKD